MELLVNGDSCEIAANSLTVTELLEQLDVPTIRGVAVAVNDSVVTRSKWDEFCVSEGDRVEIIRATQGG